MGKKSIVKFNNVNFEYEKDQRILEKLNFEIFEGDFIGIKGFNGAGKTTFIKLLLNLLTPNDGEVIFSKNISENPIGYVRQNIDMLDVNFPASVLEVVMLGLYSKIGPFKLFNKKNREEALEALKKVEMENFIDRKISELSGGQRQKVMIAKALVSDPDFLILDEPDSGIDEKSTQKLFELLRKLNADRNLTIVVISHDLEILGKYVKEIFLLKDKNLIREGKNFRI